MRECAGTGSTARKAFDEDPLATDRLLPANFSLRELLQLANAIGFDPMPRIRAAWKSVRNEPGK